MGLDISGYSSDLTYHYGYSGLHKIRAMAVMVARDITYEEAWNFLMGRQNENDDLWNSSYRLWLEREKLTRYYQLLHFTDAEGAMIKGWILEKVDVSRSMTLGNLDMLFEELEDIRLEITSKPEKYNQDELPMQPFWMLYNLVKDEAENGRAIFFH